MKNLLLLFVIVVVFGLFGCMFAKIGDDNQKGFEQCMAAGVQSEETCRFYAFQ